VVSGLIVGARAIHLAATLVIGGTAVFAAFVMPDLLLGERAASLAAVGRQVTYLLLAALSLALLSGTAWLLLLAAGIAEASVAEAIRDGTAWSVLTGTRFGQVFAARALFAFALFSLALFSLSCRQSAMRLLLSANLLLALAFVATLAWCGHAGAGTGPVARLHVGADAVHITAASAWLGALVPLLVFIRPRRRQAVPLAERIAILRRMSSLATLSVLVIVATGLVNAWILTNGFEALLGSAYGEVLLLKVGLFVAMLGFAAVNRFWFLPKLTPAQADAAAAETFARLSLFVAAEIALGVGVIVVVAVLGQMPPASE
jgi:putative copper resistance protein D